MSDNKFFKMFQKKDNSVEEAMNLKMKKIGSFFKQKMRESILSTGNQKKSVFDSDISVKDNFYKKPYATLQGLNYVEFGEALRELGIGRKDRALNVLNQMIEKATQLDPRWPDIKEMQEIVNDIKEATNEDLAKIYWVQTQL